MRGPKSWRPRHGSHQHVVSRKPSSQAIREQGVQAVSHAAVRLFSLLNSKLPRSHNIGTKPTCKQQTRTNLLSIQIVGKTDSDNLNDTPYIGQESTPAMARLGIAATQL